MLSGAADLPSALASVKKGIDELRFEKGCSEGSQFLYEKYVKTIDEKPCCPVCRRDFDQKRQADDTKRDVSCFVFAFAVSVSVCKLVFVCIGSAPLVSCATPVSDVSDVSSTLLVFFIVTVTFQSASYATVMNGTAYIQNSDFQLKSKLSQIPNQLRHLDTRLKTQETRYNQLLLLEPQADEVERLKGEVVPRLEKEVARIAAELGKASGRILEVRTTAFLRFFARFLAVFPL